MKFYVHKNYTLETRTDLALFEKIFNSNLIYNYSSYLKAIDNTFETNLSISKYKKQKQLKE